MWCDEEEERWSRKRLKDIIELLLTFSNEVDTFEGGREGGMRKGGREEGREGGRREVGRDRGREGGR